MLPLSGHVRIHVDRTPCTPAADDDAWHDRLVGYYRRFGFEPVRVVRGDCLGTLNLLHRADWYDEADIANVRLFAQLALPGILMISRT